MTDNKRFNAMLNSCQQPRRVYAALLDLGGTDECRLIDMIRNSKDPGKAIGVAIEALVEFLGGVRS